MIVKSPQYLWLLLAVIPLSVLGLVSFRRGARDLLRVVGRWRYLRMKDVYLFKNFFLHLLFLLSYVSAVLALADFRWGEVLEEERRRGQEIVFVLDISRSMMAADVADGAGAAATRLERAKSAIRLLAARLDQPRFALVVFKGAGVKLVPLTEDTYALETVLTHLSPDILTAPGSDLEQGLETALASFSDDPGRYRAILLLTDGEYHSGNPAAAADKAEQAGVPILVAALGTEEGAEISTPGGETVLDLRGNPVVTRLKLPGLRKIARQSGGEIFRLTAAEEAEKELLAALAGLWEDELSPGFLRVNRERYRFFLSLAVCFLTLGIVVRGIRWKDML
jgi:Ca-activated chloride channel family protein